MNKKDERVFGVFFVVTEKGFEKNPGNLQTAKDAHSKLLKEVEEKKETEVKIPKEIKRELIKKLQKFLDEE